MCIVFAWMFLGLECCQWKGTVETKWQSISRDSMRKVSLVPKANGRQRMLGFALYHQGEKYFDQRIFDQALSVFYEAMMILGKT